MAGSNCGKNRGGKERQKELRLSSSSSSPRGRVFGDTMNKEVCFRVLTAPCTSKGQLGRKKCRRCRAKLKIVDCVLVKGSERSVVVRTVTSVADCRCSVGSVLAGKPSSSQLNARSCNQFWLVQSPLELSFLWRSERVNILVGPGFPRQRERLASH